MKKSFLFILLSVATLFYGTFAFAQVETFFISPQYDVSGRGSIDAILVKPSSKAYWYVERAWWDALTSLEQERARQKIGALSAEFDGKIYPVLTERLGSEWNPGIDGDPRLTILLHPMARDVSGYWRSDDEYYRLQGVLSNEREMVYLNAEKLQEPLMKSYLAHEFAHLIAFNQKERRFGVEEEVWVQELVAELAPSLLGYEDVLRGSILEQRIQKFLSRPTNSLAEWQNGIYDYAPVNLFGQYVVDHYGWKVIQDLVKTQETGIAGFNTVLNSNGFREDFAEVFTNWTIALALGDCSVGSAYCYKNSHLQNFRIIPSVYFLPLSGEGTISVSLQTQDWAGNWYKLIGGHDRVLLEFRVPQGVKVRIPYIKEDSEGGFSVGELPIRENIGLLEIPLGEKRLASFSFIPTVQEKTSDFSGSAPSYTLSWTVSVKERQALPTSTVPATGGFQSEQIEALQKKIAELQMLLNSLRAQLAVLSGQKTQMACTRFERDMFYGMRGEEVRCLQEFLKKQGPEIYPEGLVTGNFFELTRAAVIRFQEKYASEILAPIGFTKGTGFVGRLTRDKMNQIGF